MGHVYTEVFIKGKRGAYKSRSLVDTGSTFSTLPPAIARKIGALKTPWSVKVELADLWKNLAHPSIRWAYQITNIFP